MEHNLIPTSQQKLSDILTGLTNEAKLKSFRNAREYCTHEAKKGNNTATFQLSLSCAEYVQNMMWSEGLLCELHRYTQDGEDYANLVLTWI